MIRGRYNRGAQRAHPDLTQELPRKLLPTRAKQPRTRRRKQPYSTRRCLWRFGSSLDLKRAHNPKVAGSNPEPATTKSKGYGRLAVALWVFTPTCSRAARFSAAEMYEV